MIRNFLAFACCAISVLGYAGSTASVGGSFKHDVDSKDNKYNIGVSVSAWMCCGVSWWSWTGYGETRNEWNPVESSWVSHQQGIDFSIGKFLKLGPVAEWKAEIPENKWSEQKDTVLLGGRIALKIW